MLVEMCGKEMPQLLTPLCMLNINTIIFMVLLAVFNCIEILNSQTS